MSSKEKYNNEVGPFNSYLVTMQRTSSFRLICHCTLSINNYCVVIPPRKRSIMSSSSWNIAMAEIWLIIFQVDILLCLFSKRLVNIWLILVKGTLSEDTIRNFLKQLGKCV